MPTTGVSTTAALPSLPPRYTISPFITPHGHSSPPIVPYGVVTTPVPVHHPHPSAYAGYASPKYYPFPPVYRTPHSPGQQHVYKPKKVEDDIKPPECARNSSATSTSCLTDAHYPTYDIQRAIEYHYSAVASLYVQCLYS